MDLALSAIPVTPINPRLMANPAVPDNAGCQIWQARKSLPQLKPGFFRFCTVGWEWPPHPAPAVCRVPSAGIGTLGWRSLKHRRLTGQDAIQAIDGSGAIPGRNFVASDGDGLCNCPHRSATRSRASCGSEPLDDSGAHLKCLPCTHALITCRFHWMMGKLHSILESIVEHARLMLCNHDNQSA